MILIEANAQRALRFDPVKADLLGAWVVGDNVGELVGDFANPRWLGTADAVLQRPADGWPQFKRRQTAHRARKSLDQNMLEAATHTRAGFTAPRGGRVRGENSISGMA